MKKNATCIEIDAVPERRREPILSWKKMIGFYNRIPFVQMNCKTDKDAMTCTAIVFIALAMICPYLILIYGFLYLQTKKGGRS